MSNISLKSWVKMNKLKIVFFTIVPIKNTFSVWINYHSLFFSASATAALFSVKNNNKRKIKHYTNLKRLMNSSLQPFTINSTTITSSIPNQYPSHRNYCEACCCHLSCRPTSKGPMTSREQIVLIGCWLGVAAWLVLPAAWVTSAPMVPVALGWGGVGPACLITQDTKIFISVLCLLNAFIYLVWMSNDIKAKAQW